MTPQYVRIRKVFIAVFVAGLLIVPLTVGASQGDDKDRELILASMRGKLEEVNRLLNSGANVNAEDQQGWTPLAWAVRARHWAVAKALLEKGAEINGKARLSRTAAIEGARNGHLEVLSALLDKGLEVDTKIKEDNTALIKAIKEGSLAKVMRLSGGDTKVEANRKPGKDQPSYGHIDETSKAKFFGVGGWPYGRDCPGIELFWKFQKIEEHDEDNEEYPAVFFQTKKGKVVRLGRGQLAMFSPDCNYFWSTWHNGMVIEVFETASGKQISSFVGYYPAWSPDSTRIFMSRTDAGKVYQLWEWSLLSKEARKIAEVTDYCECQPPGEGVAWHPVKFEANGDVIWSYSTCQKGANFRIWRVLTIAPSSGRIRETETDELSKGCD